MASEFYSHFFYNSHIRVKLTNPNPTPLIKEKVPFQSTELVLERTEIWLHVPMGPETKNDCADESQRQITALPSLQMSVKYEGGGG
jgi:hypothetical protein